MSAVNKILCVAIATMSALPVVAAESAADQDYFSLHAGTRLAGESGNEFSLSAFARSAKGWSLDASVAHTSNAQSAGVSFDSRSWSLAAGKQISAWRFNLGFAAFEDGVQVETQDFTASVGWSDARARLTLDVSSGDADELVEIPVRTGGTRFAKLTTDRLGFGLTGSIDTGEHLTLTAGYRSYDYDRSDERLASRPRLEQFLISNVFTTQQGIIDSTWNVGAAAYFGRITASLDFSRSEELDGAGSSNDLQVTIDVPFRERWALILGAGKFTTSGATSADGDSAYGSVGIQYTSR